MSGSRALYLESTPSRTKYQKFKRSVKIDLKSYESEASCTVDAAASHLQHGIRKEEWSISDPQRGSSFKITDLRTALEARGLSTDGSKKFLQSRWEKALASEEEGSEGPQFGTDVTEEDNDEDEEEEGLEEVDGQEAFEVIGDCQASVTADVHADDSAHTADVTSSIKIKIKKRYCL
jgi:hypothetical protein